MKFVVDLNPTFSHPVKVLVPVDGGHKEQQFRAKFRVMPVDEEAGFDLRTGSGSTEFLKKLVVEMSELVDASDQAVVYNDEVRDQLLRWPYVRAALTRTYYDAVGKAATGN